MALSAIGLLLFLCAHLESNSSVIECYPGGSPNGFFLDSNSVSCLSMSRAETMSTTLLVLVPVCMIVGVLIGALGVAKKRAWSGVGLVFSVLSFVVVCGMFIYNVVNIQIPM